MIKNQSEQHMKTEMDYSRMTYPIITIERSGFFDAFEEITERAVFLSEDWARIHLASNARLERSMPGWLVLNDVENNMDGTWTVTSVTRFGPTKS